MSALSIYDGGMKIAAIAVGAGAVILYLYENPPGGGGRVVHLPGTLQPGDIGARAELTCTNPCKGKIVLIDKRQNPPKDIGYWEAVLPPWYDFVIEAVLAMITAGTFIPLIVGYDIVVGFINNGVVQDAMKAEVAKLKIMVEKCKFDKYDPNHHWPSEIDSNDKLIVWAKSQAIGIEPTFDPVSGEPTFKYPHSAHDEQNTINALHAKAVQYKSSKEAIDFSTSVIHAAYTDARNDYGEWAVWYNQAPDQWARDAILAGLKSGGDKAIEAVVAWDKWEKGAGQYFTKANMTAANNYYGTLDHMSTDADVFAWWLKEHPISKEQILQYVIRYVQANDITQQSAITSTPQWSACVQLWGMAANDGYNNDDLWYTMTAAVSHQRLVDKPPTFSDPCRKDMFHASTCPYDGYCKMSARAKTNFPGSAPCPHA